MRLFGIDLTLRKAPSTGAGRERSASRLRGRRGTALRGIAVGLLGLLLGVALGFPWRALADKATAALLARAAESGAAASLVSVEVEGLLVPTFVLRGFSAQLPFFSAALSDLTVRPSLLASLRSGGPAFGFSSRGGRFLLPDGASGGFSSLEGEGVSEGGTLTLADLSMRGEVALAGTLRFAGGGLAAADLTLRVPPPFDPPLRALGMMWPLRQTDGAWRLEKNGQ